MPIHFSRYKPDNASFGRFMMSDQAAEPIEAAAKDIRDRAEETATKATGDMARNYKVIPGAPPGPIERNPRRYYDVVNDDIAAVVEEFGRKGRRAKRTLRKAASAAGPVVPGKGFHV